MKVLLKFRVQRKSESMGTSFDQETREYKQVKIGSVEMYPVTSGSDENKQFYHATPSGKIEFGSINAAAIDALPLDAEVYVTIEVAEPAAKTE